MNHPVVDCWQWAGFPQDFRFQKQGDLSRFEEKLRSFLRRKSAKYEEGFRKNDEILQKSFTVSKNKKFYILNNFQNLSKKNIYYKCTWNTTLKYLKQRLFNTINISHTKQGTDSVEPNKQNTTISQEQTEEINITNKEITSDIWGKCKIQRKIVPLTKCFVFCLLFPLNSFHML